MVLESTVICFDNSESMRNEDYFPSRFQAQKDAIELVYQSKTSSNAENKLGLLTLSNQPKVLATFNGDMSRFLSKLDNVQIHGEINFTLGIKIAQLVLRNRPEKSHKMRIVAFVGSPLHKLDEQELIDLAKRFRKEKINVDLVNFGEVDENTKKLALFVNTINGPNGTKSNLLSVPPATNLHDVLISSPLIMGEDGAGASAANRFEFGVDPSEDPELALALRISIEEQRMRVEEQARRQEGESQEQQQQPEESKPK